MKKNKLEKQEKLEVQLEFDQSTKDSLKESSFNREQGEASGETGLKEASLEEALKDEEERDVDVSRSTSDMNSPGNSETGDEGVPGGVYANDNRMDSDKPEKPINWNRRKSKPKEKI